MSKGPGAATPPAFVASVFQDGPPLRHFSSFSDQQHRLPGLYSHIVDMSHSVAGNHFPIKFGFYGDIDCLAFRGSLQRLHNGG